MKKPSRSQKGKKISLSFTKPMQALTRRHKALLTRKNKVDVSFYNGIVERYVHPVITAEHVPLDWRFDFDPATNPHFQERLGINAAFNPGAMLYQGKIVLMVRVEGVDRKSFFAVAESKTGVDGFRFWNEPVVLPEAPDAPPGTNVYDMRLMNHEDGYIYGIFCVECKDPAAGPGDESSAVAAAGIARTKDLVHWERLPDLISQSPQQRNVVLHPEFIDGQYALYTRPLNDFAATGSGPGIGWALCKDITHPVIGREQVIDPRVYHTISEGKNGLGPAPIKTDHGWLHLAHGVRNTAAGMRYVLYMMLADLHEPWRITHRPGGYFLAPQGDERIGDVSNVVFANGWVCRPDGKVFIYYGASDTRVNVVTSSINRLLDYVLNTPPDAYRSGDCVQQRLQLIRKNQRR